MKKLLATLALAFLIFGASHSAFAATKTSNNIYLTNYKVKKGDTLWKISLKSGSPLDAIRKANHFSSTMISIDPGQIITVPEKYTLKQKYLFSQLVTAEAKGEPYKGKVAVATVILNRVDSSLFPDTLRDVIYQKVGSHYAFTPVKTGTINQTPHKSVVVAVNEALAMHPTYKKTGALYYYNPRISSNTWILSQPVIQTIGHQVFAT